MYQFAAEKCFKKVCDVRVKEAVASRNAFIVDLLSLGKSKQ